MKPPKAFGDCLEELMLENGLTLSALGARLGGKPELKRALDDELSEPKRAALIGKLKELGVFNDEALLRLAAASEVSSLGLKGYLTKEAMLRLLYGPDGHGTLRKAGNEALEQRLQPLFCADTVQILLINSCYPSVFQALAPLFGDAERNVKMRHYVRLSRQGCDAATLIFCAHALIRDPRYLPHSVPDDADMQCFSGDFAIIRYWKGGKRNELFFVAQNNQNVFWIPSTSQAGVFDLALEIVNAIRPAPVMLKELGSPSSGYIDMMIRYLGLELNRTTYSLCADIGCLQVPPRIAAAAMDEEGMRRIALTEPSSAAQLRQLLERRYLNLYSKKKPDYHVTTFNGIKRFLETGRSRARFIGFRDFTPEERVAIVADLLTQARQNPLFHLQVFKERTQ